MLWSHFYKELNNVGLQRHFFVMLLFISNWQWNTFFTYPITHRLCTELGAPPTVRLLYNGRQGDGAGWIPGCTDSGWWSWLDILLSWCRTCEHSAPLVVSRRTLRAEQTTCKPERPLWSAHTWLTRALLLKLKRCSRHKEHWHLHRLISIVS